MATIDMRGATLSAADPPIGTNPNPDLAIKAPVRVATTGANIVLSGLQTIDGVALAAGDRVLVKDQADQTTNGIYNAATGPWTRTIDANNNSQWTTGTAVKVTAGTANANKSYQLTTANPILLGISLMAFAIISVAGNFVGDAGSGGAAGAVPAPTAGQGAINAVLKASGVFGVVGLTNVRLAKTGTYAAINADKGKTIALGGNAFYTLSFGAASGFDADFMAVIVNEDGVRAKAIALNGVTTFFLYPGQSIIVLTDNGTWQTVGKSRWKLSGSIPLYVNASLGSDSNDGFAAGAGAKATAQAAFYQIANDFDYNSGSGVVTVTLGANDTTGIHWGPHGLVGAASGGCITLDGGGFSLSCTTDSALHLFFGAVLYVQNITLMPGISHSAVSMEHGARILFKSGVTWGAGTSTGGAHLQMDDNSSAEFDADYSIAGSAGNHIINNHGSSVRCAASLTVTFTGNATFGTSGGGFVWAVNGAIIDYSLATINLGAFSVTSTKRHEADNLGLIESRTGVPNTFWPGDSNGSTSNGGQSV